MKIMLLKDIVDGLLKEENRSLSWLANEMKMTFDGLKLSLVKGSLKFKDIRRMAAILKVEPYLFFNLSDMEERGKFLLGEENNTYSSLRSELASTKELVIALRNQLKDKEKIIELLMSGKFS